MSKQTHEPAFRAFSVIERGEGRDAFWQPIGAAFENSDGSLNVILQALPIGNGDGTCKIVLRKPKEDQNDNDRGGQSNNGAPKSHNRQRR